LFGCATHKREAPAALDALNANQGTLVDLLTAHPSMLIPTKIDPVPPASPITLGIPLFTTTAQGLPA